MAVELAYGADFELAEDDAEILVKLRGRDVLWQKERLLNIALQALPSSCRKVAWVDCDVIFENNDWPQRTSMLLDAFTMVQPFSHVHWMPPDWESGRELLPDGQLRAVPLLIAAGMPVGTCLGTPASQSQCSCGYAWAANRALLEKNKLYDACIVGGGDSAMVRAAYGRFEDALRLQALNRDHYLNWAIPFHNAVHSDVGFVEGAIFHLWHGKPGDRRYRERNDGLRRFQFDPLSDVAIDQNGVWRWNSDKPEMHDFVRDYFFLRREDG